MQELNRQMMALPELRELEEIIRFGTGPAAVSGVSGVHRAMLGAALRQEKAEAGKAKYAEHEDTVQEILSKAGALTEKLTAFLCKKKGISPADAPLLSMEQYRQQQFDLLADGVRAALDMDAVYAAMGMDRKGGNRV